jgi:hypothetical protein
VTNHVPTPGRLLCRYASPTTVQPELGLVIALHEYSCPDFFEVTVLVGVKRNTWILNKLDAGLTWRVLKA